MLQLLADANPELYAIFREGDSLEEVRDAVFAYVERAERAVFDPDNELHTLEKIVIRQCAGVMRSIAGRVNELNTEFSALDCLWKLARDRRAELVTGVGPGFMMEFVHLFRGLAGRSLMYGPHPSRRHIPEFLKLEGRAAAHARTTTLDDMASEVRKYFKKYPSGLEPEVISWRRSNRNRLLGYFKGSLKDWANWKWHIRNVIKEPQPLLDLIELSEEQKQAVRRAVKHHIPFGITPYYLSLMDRNSAIGFDHAVRAQVIPPPEYVDEMSRNLEQRAEVFDFMGEYDTSPQDLVTRRYPMIGILKPFNTCAQICVYCQRNWEIEECLAPHAKASEKEIDRALEWFAQHPGVGDVLVTGGDPLIMSDNDIDVLLGKIAALPQVYRIRLGSRTPVVLPQRWTDELVGIIAAYHQPGKREIAVVTHFEHSYEVTPEARSAVDKIRKAGLSVFNQQVYTIENCRRFETAKLRRDLKTIGVDPYYTFNMKGKEETRRYMVPIARILQERKEEARLLPGLDRTGEPVFNVPKLGKNHLRAMQDHQVIMILPDGSRVYEFHPWEKYIMAVPTYTYVDRPILSFLEELATRGEDILQYKTIWYYY
ncbi:KamA family radical SAM protein [bacterium]|nr:KamA family radical SAM protein [candidate division CSSED10-310 bacterium]